jgi:hypothetical protein
MAKFYTELNEQHRDFITAQKLFFVATAPTEGRINLSPKGLDVLRIIDNNTIAYLDVTGSGNETAAHLFDDGRITVMFCSFGEKPLILRLHGHGKVILKRDPAWAEWAARFTQPPGTRQIFVMTIQSVQTSCGQGVPEFEFKRDRGMMEQSALKRGEDGILAYQQKHNQLSIDDLPTRLLVD